MQRGSSPRTTLGTAINVVRAATRRTPLRHLQHGGPRPQVVARGDGFEVLSGERMAVVRSPHHPEPKTGIYLKGACDLPSVFELPALLGAEVRGTVAVVRGHGNIADSRSDVLLQTLEEIPEELTREVSERLGLSPDYFRPTLFEPEFFVPGLEELGPFRKDVVVLSTAPHIVRTMYRHREHGFLVDPGGWWFNQSLDHVIRDQDNVKWFRDTFTQVGRLKVEEFRDLFGRVVRLVQERTGARVLVFNVLTVEPGDLVHNYQLRKSAEGMRRREFCVALDDLAEELQFDVVDIDRILKREGVERQVDFAHFPRDLFVPIARETLRKLREVEVL